MNRERERKICRRGLLDGALLPQRPQRQPQPVDLRVVCIIIITSSSSSSSNASIVIDITSLCHVIVSYSGPFWALPTRPWPRGGHGIRLLVTIQYVYIYIYMANK